jgi:hypothetical protein
MSIENETTMQSRHPHFNSPNNSALKCDALEQFRAERRQREADQRHERDRVKGARESTRARRQALAGHRPLKRRRLPMGGGGAPAAAARGQRPAALATCVG